MPTLRELATEPFLLHEEGSGSRHVIDQHMRDTGIQLQVRLSLASNKAIRKLVAKGIGLTVLSRQGARVTAHGTMASPFSTSPASR
jgi:DNA-binding transcriptional LysR family regulator